LALGRTTSKATLVFNFLFHTPTLTVKDVENIAGLRNPNALLLIGKMVNLGILEEITGRKRNRVFRYQKYVNLFD